MRWQSRTCCVVTCEEEAEAARIRCDPDAWAADTPPQAVTAAMQQLHRQPWVKWWLGHLAA